MCALLGVVLVDRVHVAREGLHGLLEAGLVDVGPGGASGFGSSFRPFEIAKAEARRERSAFPQRGQAGVFSVFTARERKLSTRWQWRQ